MSAIRPQYHFRHANGDVLIWDVRRLVELSRELPVMRVDPNQFAELHENHWYTSESDQPTPASLLEHMALIDACDIGYPIILDASGRVMDGMHRICKAVREGLTDIPAVQFVSDPAPDYMNLSPEELTYE